MRRIFIYMMWILTVCSGMAQSLPNSGVSFLESVKFYPLEELICGDLYRGGYDITIKLSDPLLASKAIVKCFNQNEEMIREIEVHFYEKDGLPYYRYEDLLRKRERPFKRNVALIHVPIYNYSARGDANSDILYAVEVNVLDAGNNMIAQLNGTRLIAVDLYW